jgi:hypothetical protein
VALAIAWSSECLGRIVPRHPAYHGPQGWRFIDVYEWSAEAGRVFGGGDILTLLTAILALLTLVVTVATLIYYMKRQ